MRITIHQPEHMPWLGFFHKISMADDLVILDSVQYRKNYFQNRNKILTNESWQWITVPVKNSFGQLIKDVQIDGDNKVWKRKYWDSVCHAYQKKPFFKRYAKDIKDIICKERIFLAELNCALIFKLMDFLKLTPNVIRSSQMKVQGKGSELLLDICIKAKADTYISGISGKEYLDVGSFEKSGIKVVFQEFHHPIYDQMRDCFLECMSVIDLLFNYGEKSLDVIKGKGVAVMEEVLL
ncbi:WbqC family protein [Candidatus Omnitrophota bacterium]